MWDASLTNEIILKLFLSVLLGGLIGVEREFHGRAAGLRTHIMVCLGSTIILASFQMFHDSFASQGAESVYRIDPSRVAAGVVTGIGFLGAGTIIRSKELVSGLTTAACIWFVATIGIVLGCGIYLPAILGTFFGLLVLIGLNPVGQGIPSYRYGKITIDFKNVTAEEIENQCSRILQAYQTVTQNTLIYVNVTTGKRTLAIYVRGRDDKNKHSILKEIVVLKNVTNVAWE